MNKFLTALKLAAPAIGQEFSANTFTAHVEGMRRGKPTQDALRLLAANGIITFTGKVATWKRVA